MTDALLIELAGDAANDTRVRKLIRMGLKQRAVALQRHGPGDEDGLLARMPDYPLDWAGSEANRQHYEVPPAFFQAVLGPHLKYSCCLWDGADDLGGAEAAMLDAVIARADLADGQRILDLGCGWGALSLALAKRFPRAEIVALSSSTDQRRFIEARRDAAGCGNLKIVTSQVGAWDGEGVFDRVVSVEMFEHIRNWPALLQRVSAWLARDGLFFVHIFCHARASYFFETDLTARYFFTGGLMPARDLLPRVCAPFTLIGEWAVSGMDYQETAEAWLVNLDKRRAEALSALASGADPRPPAEQLAAWRLFFMITAESFGYGQGREWMVAHYLFRKRSLR